jgi:heavy metal translocating P-type ATPase
MQIQKISRYIAFALSAIGIILYLILFFGLHRQQFAADLALWILIIGSLPFAIDMVIDVLKGKFGVDIIAISAIVVAILLKDYLPGIVILFMLSGGGALEEYAMQRARKELTTLISNAPTVAHLKEGSKITDIPADSVAKGSVILVKPGEIIPADSIVLGGRSSVDQSAITGESVPVQARPGMQLLSGSINRDDPLELQTIRESKDSQYAQLIKLVQNAEESKAPIVRLADSYTIFFTVITFVLAASSWFFSHDPVRLLAVLVVATPCPLILATPIAIISGISRAAKRGAIIKDGGALEQLGNAKAFVFDKTGTLTLGKPEIFEVSIVREGIDKNEILRLAASLDQLSMHILARSLVQNAELAKIELEYPQAYEEISGEGVSAVLGLDKDREGAEAVRQCSLYGQCEFKTGTKYHFGKLSFILKQGISVDEGIILAHDKRQGSGMMAVYLADAQGLLAIIFFADVVRSETRQVFDLLHFFGIHKIVMLTGDRQEVADRIAKEVGLKDVVAECLPEQKVGQIKSLQGEGLFPVVMVGDGVNDAPALATANVGIAMGAHGSSASSEAGDVVITVDDLNRVPEVFGIAKHAIYIAKQGIWIGIGLSIVLMIFAAFGLIPPLSGAILQECVDVLVIFNALRVLVYNFGVRPQNWCYKNQ